MMKKPKQLFDVSKHSMTIATVVILIAIFLFSGFTISPTLENPRMTFKEEPIEKNTELQIVPGDRFVYAYEVNETQFNITYEATQGPGCVLIELTESINNSRTCLNIQGNDNSGYDSVLEEPTILLFKPWMLALRENWEWNNSMYMTFDEMESKVTETYYRVMRTEIYRGRLSYVVEIRSDTGPFEYEWIDVEKRILLKSFGDAYSIELIDGLEFETNITE